MRYTADNRRNPTDRNYPDPRSLTGAPRDLWSATFRNALDYYSSQDIEGSRSELEHTANATAWKGLALAYPEASGLQIPNPSRVPNPGPVLLLGKVVRFVAVSEPPDLDVYEMTQPLPDMLWSDEHKMLLAMPGLRIPPERKACVDGDCRTAMGRFHDWAQRHARGHTHVQVPAYALEPLGVADSFTYVSDKWGPDVGHKNSQEYIHQFGDGVFAYVDDAWERGHGDPDIVVFDGGRLDMRPEGIVN